MEIEGTLNLWFSFGGVGYNPNDFYRISATAIVGAFFNRFASGFLICNVVLPIPIWLKGVIVAVLVSLPDAIITEAYAPILGTAVVGGLIIGWVAGKFGRSNLNYANV